MSDSILLCPFTGEGHEFTDEVRGWRTCDYCGRAFRVEVLDKAFTEPVPEPAAPSPSDSGEGGVMDLEVVQIQDEFAAHARTRRRWIVVEEDSGFSVHEHSPDGVAPPSHYDTATEACARVMQLMGIRVGVLPQSWPEEVLVGRVDSNEP